MKRRIVALFLVLIFMMSCFQACSKKEDGKENNSQEATASDTSAKDSSGKDGTGRNDADTADAAGTGQNNADMTDAAGTNQNNADTTDAAGTDKNNADTTDAAGTGQNDADTTDAAGTDRNNPDTANTAGTVGSAAGSGEGQADMSALMAMYAMQMAQSEPVEKIDLPEKSDIFSMELAKEALTLCTGYSKYSEAQLLTDSGFEVIMQQGYEKTANDISHTCAFSVAKKQVEYNGEQRTLLLVAIRGTNGSEWFSNFDFSASRKNDTVFADNFLQAAQTVNFSLLPVLVENPDALILVCGHSRGAACANLLGMTLDDMRGRENVFVYTFATPNTYRGDGKTTGYENIFNLINPADVVTEVPLKGLGYHHIGVDIVLPCEPETALRISTAMNSLYESATTVEKYYGERHSLVKAGLANDGMTAFEVMQALASSMTGVRLEANKNRNMQDIYELTGASATAGESDFAPLLTQLEKIIGRDGSFGTNILAQHMPATYGALMDAYAKLSLAGGAIPEGFAGFDGQLPEGYEGLAGGAIPEGFTGFDGQLPEGYEGLAGGAIPEGFTGLDGQLPEGYEGMVTE